MQRRITESVSQSNFGMQLDLLRSQFEEYQQIHTKELHQFNTKIHTAKFEIENEIAGKLDEKLRGWEPQGSAEMNTFKSEIYNYLQSKLKQITKSYSSKFTQLFSQVETTEGKLREMNDLNNDTDFQFEEFKDQIGLKHKLLLDSVSN